MNFAFGVPYILLQFMFLGFCTCLDTISITQPIRDSPDGDGDVLVSNGETFALGFFSPGKSNYATLEFALSTNGYSVAQLLDSGNLVLFQNESKKPLWQSFDYPTDTMLPNMKIGLDRRTGINKFLTSWESEDDPSEGNYTYRIDPAGYPQLMLYKWLMNLDWFNGLFCWTKSVDGHVSSMPEALDQYGYCGAFGLCDYNNTSEFECTCLPGFEPKSYSEWKFRDATHGCVRKPGSLICSEAQYAKKSKGFVATKEVSSNYGGLRSLILFSIGVFAYWFAKRKRKGSGFGSVYKGQLVNGQEIAVKRLSKHSGQGMQEFKNEVMVIAKLQHRNLVRLLDATRRADLDWSKRFEIICGIARGILYLHQDSRLKIIHRDLKASNVLLDASMNTKFSDFGMAKIFGRPNSSKTSRIVVATCHQSMQCMGYIQPNPTFSAFGVLLLEIISSRKSTECINGSHFPNLIGHLIHYVSHFLPTRFHEASTLGCYVYRKQQQRPTMSDVIFMLANETTLPLPNTPAFTSHYADSSKSSGAISWNRVSITALEGR
ncbi:hypothetical protein FNV43_RR01393 [Rhamnella rubrinervis]|uniref:non-specific serine/threonine protein kinase n=1 Tax=Rhamnella rubrinervis TaxID=2594499 RepID=A0A8K0MST5_9ROSA|nr:hypothetical protein FNV43_RR01393 [Rhamnella rubrinervis]